MGNYTRSQTEYLDEEQNDGDEEEGQQGQGENRSDQIYYSGSVTPEGGRHKIHCLTIIGQVEGHYILPPRTKLPNTSMLSPSWWPSNRIVPSRDCLSS